MPRMPKLEVTVIELPPPDWHIDVLRESADAIVKIPFVANLWGLVHEATQTPTNSLLIQLTDGSTWTLSLDPVIDE